jgi:hypothetical protein
VIIVLVIIALVAVVGLFLALRRPPRREPGMVSFQRHIDALSPEARRQVRDHLHTDDDDSDVDGDDNGDDNGAADVDGNEDH